MPKTLPLILATGTITLFTADLDGQPILTQPVWMGARAEGLQLSAEISEVEASRSGAPFDEYAQLSELHEIAIDRIWVLPLGPEAGPGAERFVDYDLTRGRYVMKVFWIDERSGLWHERIYYGVQAKRYGLQSNGVIQFGSNQVFRAQYFLPGRGSSGNDGSLTPETPVAFEMPVLFSHDEALVNGDYFIGTYQFAAPVRIGLTKVIGQAGGSPIVLTLEIAGVLSAHTLTLPGGSGEVSDSETFAVDVMANQTLRWKVTSGSGADRVGITMRIQEL